MKKLTLMDTMFLLLESRETMMHVGSLTIFKIPDNYHGNFFHELKGRMRNVTEFAPPFNYRLSYSLANMGLPVWIEDRKLDLDYHVRHSALPKPGTMNELMTLVSRLHGTLLDRNRPLWEFYIIEGLEHNRFAIYAKMHHAMIDGMAGMRLIENMLSKSSEEFNFKPIWQASTHKAKKMKPSKDWKQTLDSTFQLLKKQALTLPEVTNSFLQLGGAITGGKGSNLPLPFSAPKTLLNAPISGQRRFAICSLKMKAVKHLCDETDATINEIVLAVCAGALRRYLMEKNALPEEPLTTLVPVSVRSDKEGDGGNALGNLFVNLNTHIADPLERLAAIKASSTAGKSLLSSMSSAATTNYSMLLGSPAIMLNLLRVAGHLTPSFNVLISNVPGPKEERFLNGARLEGLYPVAFLFEGQALNITVTSYLDSLDFGLIACRENLPSLPKLADYLPLAFQELQKLTKKSS